MKLTTLLILALASLISSCLLPSEVNPNLAANTWVPPAPRTHIPIGTGDRFANGTLAPVGLGVHDRNLKSILTPTEIDSGLRALANLFPKDVTLFQPPYTTYENAHLHGASVGANPRVFIMSGIHARERGGPDDVLYFLADLLQARLARTGIKYGDAVYTRQQVVTALNVGIVVLPLVNPDGVAYDQQTDSCWRKNRNPASSVLDPGVDLNRNFDFLWNYTEAFSSQADLSAAASDDPASEVFHGEAPMSEPEVKNVEWVLDSFPNLTWFLDLHSFGGEILYAWGDDNLQTQNKTQNFLNSGFDGKRGITGVDPPGLHYREYMLAVDAAAQHAVGIRMKNAMALAGSTPYSVEESVSLYPTSGTSTDWVQARWYGRECGATKIHGLTLEFGEGSYATTCPFYPDHAEYHQWMREVSVGLMELMLNAAEGGDPVVWEC
ncbi:hypothetical protein B0T10DRAFT_80248 [Thelonectria olida]|uniref:Peptidase M14 domain-containing protein n=1 Tax=Thelonectria olida TaxID=1576542 RepID=A0A9P9AMI2_9HYPO|nr:hypothetical protein B0T10DRAFT_80248 [Thelonectria olida]